MVCEHKNKLKFFKDKNRVICLECGEVWDKTFPSYYYYCPDKMTVPGEITSTDGTGKTNEELLKPYRVK